VLVALYRPEARMGGDAARMAGGEAQPATDGDFIGMKE